MTLPKIDHPIYDVTIPSTGKRVHVRPYRVKEERILLIARESGDIEEMTLAMEQIISNCLMDQVEINKLATFDFDYLFLKLRALSGGETIALRYPVKCEDPKCEQVGHCTLNLSKDVKINQEVQKPPVYALSEGVQIKMRYPSVRDMRTIAKYSTEADRVLALIACCIDQIVHGDKLLHTDDYTTDELMKWVETFSSENYKPIIKFFETIPELQATVTFKCRKCEAEAKDITLRGLESFFV